MGDDRGFDPCRQWLGIDALDLLHPHRVLDLDAGEKDPVVIVRAADARLSFLRGVDPGPYAATRDALVTRVAEARDALLASATGRPPMPNVPRPPASSGPRLAPPPAPGVIAPPPVPAFRGPNDVPRTEPEPGGPIVIRTGGSQRRSAGSGGLPSVISLLLVAAAGVMAYLAWPLLQEALQRRRQVAGVARQEVPNEDDAPSEPRIVRPRDGRLPLPVQSETVEPAVAEPATPRSGGDESRAEVPAAEPASPAAAAPQEPVDEAPAAMKPSSETAVDTAAAGGTAPDEPPADRPQPKPFSELLTNPDSSPRRDPPDAAAAPDRSTPSRGAPPRDPATPDRAAVEAAISRASKAMGVGDVDEAKRALAEALTAAAGDRVMKERVQRWQRLEHYVREFATYRDRALATAMGNDYPLGNTVISIVEVTDETFEYRKLGQNIKVARDKIPATVVHTIVNRWFAASPRPTNDLYLGAYLFVQGPRGGDLARRAWQRAADRGERDGELLLRLFNDPLAQSADDEAPDDGPEPSSRR